jgi:hypothetical protein
MADAVFVSAAIATVRERAEELLLWKDSTTKFGIDHERLRDILPYLQAINIDDVAELLHKAHERYSGTYIKVPLKFINFICNL